MAGFSYKEMVIRRFEFLSNMAPDKKLVFVLLSILMFMRQCYRTQYSYARLTVRVEHDSITMTTRLVASQLTFAVLFARGPPARVDRVLTREALHLGPRAFG